VAAAASEADAGIEQLCGVLDALIDGLRSMSAAIPTRTQ